MTEADTNGACTTLPGTVDAVATTVRDDFSAASPALINPTSGACERTQPAHEYSCNTRLPPLPQDDMCSGSEAMCLEVAILLADLSAAVAATRTAQLLLEHRKELLLLLLPDLHAPLVPPSAVSTLPDTAETVAQTEALSVAEYRSIQRERARVYHEHAALVQKVTVLRARVVQARVLWKHLLPSVGVRGGTAMVFRGMTDLRIAEARIKELEDSMDRLVC